MQETSMPSQQWCNLRSARSREPRMMHHESLVLSALLRYEGIRPSSQFNGSGISVCSSDEGIKSRSCTTIACSTHQQHAPYQKAYWHFFLML